MDKNVLQRFVEKYYLGGAADAALWRMDADGLHVEFTTEGRDCIGFITAKSLKLDHGEYPVLDAGQFLGLLRVLEDGEVAFSIKTDRDKPVAFTLKDKVTQVTKVLADRRAMPPSPKATNFPPMDVVFNLDPDFNTTFMRAKSALSDVKSMVFMSDGQTCEVVLGYEAAFNTNRVSIAVTPTTNAPLPPLSYNSDLFRAIVMNNKDATKSTVEVSSRGLCHMAFEVEDFAVDYYLLKTQ